MGEGGRRGTRRKKTGLRDDDDDDEEEEELEDIDEEATREWLEDVELNEPIKNGYPKCEKHGIYHSIFVCISCNDDDLE